MGALTSKPYAFNARPWELQRFNGVDFLDGFGSSIYVDVRGTRVVRITPRINEELNEEWITDKVRFFYDGIARQRIGFPMFSDRAKSNKIFIKLSWTQALNILKSKIVDNYSLINILLGSLLDITGMSTMKRALTIIGGKRVKFYSSFTIPRMELDFRPFYIFRGSLRLLERAKKVILIGCMPRLESPLFNLKLIRASKQLDFSLYSIGVTPSIGYGCEVKNLGLNITRVVANLTWGRIGLSSLLINSKSNLIVLGSQIFQLSENSIGLLKSLLYKLILELNQTVESSLFCLYSTHFIPNMAEVGVLSNDLNSSIANKSNGLLLNIFEEDVKYNRNDFDFVTSVMCNGESNAMNSDLVLPAAHPFEYRSSYLNNFGILDTNKIYSIKPFMESKPVFEIFHLFQIAYKRKIILLAQFFDKLVFFRKTFLLKNWFGSLVSLNDMICLNYFKNYIMSSDLVLEFLVSDTVSELSNFSNLYSSRYFIHDFQKSLKGIYNVSLLQLALYEYYLSDPFTRVSKTLNLARQRFCPSEIYS